MDLSAFGEPWEQIRLLSDPLRNRTLRTLLERHARGARVLEVGCGHGIWACAAAKLGATQVIAVEPTAMAELARELVRVNGLERVVSVHPCLVQDLPPQPVDLVFSELLNADPFQEDIVGAMGAAAKWLAPGGRLAPSRLRVWAALARDRGSAREHTLAADELRALGEVFGLDTRPALDHMAQPGPYRYITSTVQACSAPVLLYDLDLRRRPRVPRRLAVEVEAAEPGPASAAVVWFEATYDEDLTLANPPGEAGHWGNLLCAWPEERGLRAGERLTLNVTLDEDGVTVQPR